MLIEFGWAFFCRYESCLEADLKRRGITLKKNYHLIDWLEERKVVIPDDFRPALKIYRDIRNKLHHEDGISFDKSNDSEIHLYPEHMENFFDFFIWCGDQIAVGS